MIRRLWPFVTGSVALGLDAYVIAGLLPAVALSLGSSEATVGLGVAAFTGAYAVTGPVLAGRAGRRPRRSLVLALTVFTAANLATMAAPGVGTFLAARAVAGAAAGVYSPLSSAVAAELVAGPQRGRALALVLAGLAVGTVFGVPAGLLVAERWGWRAAIALVAATGAAALAGVVLRGGQLPAIPASSPGQRIRAVARPDNLLTIVVTLLTGVASLGLYTYLSVVLGESALARHQTVAIWVWGLGGAIGAIGIGHLVDRAASVRISLALLTGLACALTAMTMAHTPTVLLAGLFVWGLCGWASLTPQQHILLDSTPDDGATAVAANASANYLGSAIGAAGGSVLVAQHLTPTHLCLTAAGIATLALVLQAARARMSPRR